MAANGLCGDRGWAVRDETTGRRLLQWAILRGEAATELRETFGRAPDEPLPDFADVPGSIFEFQTPPGTYFDLYPIHVLMSSTLQ